MLFHKIPVFFLDGLPLLGLTYFYQAAQRLIILTSIRPCAARFATKKSSKPVFKHCQIPEPASLVQVKLVLLYYNVREGHIAIIPVTQNVGLLRG